MRPLCPQQATARATGTYALGQAFPSLVTWHKSATMLEMSTESMVERTVVTPRDEQQRSYISYTSHNSPSLA